MSALLMRQSSTRLQRQRSGSSIRGRSGKRASIQVPIGLINEEIEEQDENSSTHFVRRPQSILSDGKPPTYSISIEEKDEGEEEEDKGEREKEEKTTDETVEEEIPKGCWEKTKFYYEKYEIKRLVAVLLLVAYSLFGAIVFHAIEYENEKLLQKEYKAELERTRSKATEKLLKILRYPPPTHNTKRNATYEFIVWYEHELGLNKDSAGLTWDIWGAMFYVGTICSTIGYGNIYPNTVGGQVFTMIYAIFGIPLVLSILGELGKFFCRWGNLFWFKFRRFRRRIGNSLCPAAQKKVTLQRSSIHSMMNSITSSVGLKVEDFESDTMPVTLALSLCLGWLLFCSGMFCLWEREWSYFTSFYFSFISLSTVGLGDVTPSHPKMMILAFGFVIIGLSLVSMTINVIQQKIEEYLNNIMLRIREEYQRALEMGEGPEKDEILAKIMKDQPWYLKKIMPAIMGEKQKEKIQNHIAEQEEISVNLVTNTKMVQTQGAVLVDTDTQVRPYATYYSDAIL